MFTLYNMALAIYSDTLLQACISAFPGGKMLAYDMGELSWCWKE
jgi:hypothetical protein